MVVITCKKCGNIVMQFDIDERTSYDYLDNWRKPDNHLCNRCWVEIKKIDHKIQNTLGDL